MRFEEACLYLPAVLGRLEGGRVDPVVKVVSNLASRVSYVFVDEPIRVNGRFAAAVTNGLTVVLSGVIRNRDEFNWAVLHELGHVAAVRLSGLRVLLLCSLLKCRFAEDPVEEFADAVAAYISKVLGLGAARSVVECRCRGIGVYEAIRVGRSLDPCLAKVPRRGNRRSQVPRRVS